jgi:tetratricopeptide (TPR) repeat protein
VGDRLRSLWNFDDLDESERRFREQLEREADDEERAEVLTQLARIEALRGRFDEGERLLAEAESRVGSHPRIDLERGRLLRSRGDERAALPLFVSAFEFGEGFLAADAAHMAALVDPAGPAAWTRRGLELAAADPDAAYWEGPLLNNLGWAHFEAEEYEQALDAFEGALRARKRDPTNEYAIEIARYAVGKTLRALGRPAEALPLLEQAVAWATAAGRRDPFFEEELAEITAALAGSS